MMKPGPGKGPTISAAIISSMPTTNSVRRTCAFVRNRRYRLRFAMSRDMGRQKACCKAGTDQSRVTYRAMSARVRVRTWAKGGVLVRGEQAVGRGGGEGGGV